MTIREIENVIRIAFGFGDLRAPYWFIGLEPGLSRTEPKKRKKIIANRISAWQGHEIDDLYEYHSRINVNQWFGPEAKLQRTWAKLIRMLLVLNGKPADVESIRKFQSDEWGRTKSKTCLLELFPLPCPSTKEEAWKACYPFERHDYEIRCRKLRVPRLKELIREYRPKAVIFYGMMRRRMEDWKLISDAGFDNSRDGFFIEGKQGTLFVVIQHPASYGPTNEYFEKIAIKIHRQLRKA
ncbi:MAG: hypothetical protein Q7U76_04470 [Nitrospirota bacterium]|nr:hypothetical protein [Nitrospirota bacterium]